MLPLKNNLTIPPGLVLLPDRFNLETSGAETFGLVATDSGSIDLSSVAAISAGVLGINTNIGLSLGKIAKSVKL